MHLSLLFLVVSLASVTLLLPPSTLANSSVSHLKNFDWSTLDDKPTSRINVGYPSERVSHQSLIRITAKNSQHVSQIYQLLIDFDLDVWSFSQYEILVRTTHGLSSDDVTNLIHRYQTPSSILVDTVIEDVQRDVVDRERQARMQRRINLALSSIASIKDFVNRPDEWFSDYHPFDEIISWYKELSNQYPSRVLKFLDDIGTTHEGRKLVALHITSVNSSQPLSTKKQVYIQGGIHAREWISHATTQYIAYHLITSNDPHIVDLLTRIEFIIVPVVNPDGYVYTWEHDRLWRKNRRNNGGGAYGVDLNRNYDANWGHGGSSGFPHSDTYKGPSAASEPEVKALQDYFNSHPRIVAGLDLHSYSQLILRPIGWDRRDAPHERQHREVGRTMSKIIKKVHGKSYTSEKSIDLYATTGAASDYFYLQKFPVDHSMDAPHGAKFVRPYGLTIELRPSPDWWGPGFVLPNDEIIPTGEEILPAVLHYAETAAKAPLYE